MSSKYYDLLGVDKNASSDEIKKAYRKKAMEYHPDRAKWDKKQAEKKFKEIWEAYDTLSDPDKKKNYDTFGSSKSNPFGWWNSYNSGWFSWFEDMFGSWWRSQSWWFWWWGFEFNIEDLFWERQTRNSSKKPKEEKEEPISLDFEKTYEIPIFDFILWSKVNVKWVYGQNSTIKIPAWTKPWVKMRVKALGKKEWWKVWNLIVKLEAKMPNHISEMDKQMLERIKDWIWY